MKKIQMGLSIIVLMLLFSNQVALAQNNEIVNGLKLTQKDSFLVVEFSLNTLPGGNHYDISLRLYDSTNFKLVTPDIDPSSLRQLKAGDTYSYKISYKQNSLSSFLNYGVKIHILHAYNLSQSNTSPVLKSLLVPGLGNYGQYRQGNTVGTIVTATSYGCIAYGVYNQIVAAQKYNQYKNSYNQAEMNELFDEVKSKQQLGQTLTFIGIGIWAADIIQVSMFRKSKTTSSTKLNYSFVPSNNAISLNLKYRF